LLDDAPSHVVEASANTLSSFVTLAAAFVSGRREILPVDF